MFENRTCRAPLKTNERSSPPSTASFSKLEGGIEASKKEGLSAEFVTELRNAIHRESLVMQVN
ncbi:hypothetical protein FHW36_10485 [Chitinophaga polysaccharea]|uniref:Uncharacterized protein n=1 Tax=Chitinophaga polysaccharea TaxID=1293035 RepID=A0A561PQN7_9BACT|nr:hypothetical protein FHW36_10485 [Chitinophaga polysaccharea]